MFGRVLLSLISLCVVVSSLSLVVVSFFNEICLSVILKGDLFAAFLSPLAGLLVVERRVSPLTSRLPLSQKKNKSSYCTVYSALSRSLSRL